MKEKGATKNGSKERYAVLLTIGTGLLLTGLGFITRLEGDDAFSDRDTYHVSAFA